ncbi:hypothetical protein TIFTF001_040828 [Ficus carica]|uniref:Uncharacterized protein n=1 Tax=Ficus carica TaxID=3494 RepID=A0AA88CLP5_FICCA|nr:hypothetical protein TIFTF001_040828 [Ficus carica]
MKLSSRASSRVSVGPVMFSSPARPSERVSHKCQSRREFFTTARLLACLPFSAWVPFSNG